MTSILYYERLGCYATWNIVSHVQEQTFYANPTWVIPLRFVGMDVKHAASIWRIMMNSNDVDMEDKYVVFFDTITSNAT